MNMNRLVLLTLSSAAVLAAEPPIAPFSAEGKIAIHNTILAKAQGTTISVLDVKKKLDLLFHKNYPHLAQSNQARCQFYEASWRHVLMEMVDHQLILADAAARDVKVTDGEVR